MDLNKNKPQKFLALLANELLTKYGEELHKTTIVFPNRRAGLFLEKALLKQISKPIWLPKTVGFDDFLQNHFNQEYSSDLDIRVGLFKCYNKVYKNPKDFPEFLKWSSTIISDFNDIIESLTSPEELLKNLIAIRKLENWSPHNEDKLNIQNEFFGFWDNLPILYNQFLNLFESGELFSRSYAEKKYLNDLENGLIPQNTKLIFAGFNALSNAEQQIFTKLKSLNLANFYWDIDEYYFNNSIHEASAPLKKVLMSLKIDNPNFISNNLVGTEKQIEIYGTSGNFAQIKLAGNILSNIPKNQLHKTAVVLCNPDLSSQLLSAIPQEIESLNISLGYPIKSHQAFHFFEQLILFWREIELKKSSNQSPIASFKKIQIFFDNDFFKKFNNYEELKSINNFFLKNGITFLNQATLEELEKNVELKNSFNQTLINWLKYVLNNQPSKHNISVFFEIYSKAIQAEKDSVDKLTQEVFFLLNDEISELDEKLEQLKLPNNPDNYVALFTHLIAQLTIDLIGEPLAGLQIIGLLETRNLDFENLVFLSVNEGILPSGKKLESLIPYDLRKGFGLPTYEHHDGIFAYHFYRAIQRAKNVYLLYNALTDGMGKGEKSRFILQMESEKPLSKFIIQNQIKSMPFVPKATRQVFGEVNPINQKQLINYLSNSGLSPSALNTYLLNPLEFFFRYVEGVKEPEELSEQMEASTLGDIVHGILQILYESFDLKIENDQNLKVAQKQVEPLLDTEFKNRFGHLPKISGKNVLIKEVIKNFIEGVIKFDIANPNFSLVGLETNLEHYLEIDNQKIKLRGNADRIDFHKNTYRIIDYKTGYVDSKELKIVTIEELFEDGTKPKALQLLFYGYLFFKSKNDLQNLRVSSGILSTKNTSSGLLNLKIGNSDILTAEHFSLFEENLVKCISGIITAKEFKEEIYPKFPPFFQ